MDENYTTDRGLDAYQVVLGTDFTRRLFALRADQHWIDAGAGQALPARDYLRRQQPGHRARITAIGLQRPADLDDCERDGALLYLAGRFEEVPLETIGMADLITDVYGPLQYALQPDEVLERYGRLLKPGGSLWIAIPAGMFLQSESGDTVEVHDWLRAIEGLSPLTTNATCARRRSPETTQSLRCHPSASCATSTVRRPIANTASQC